MVDGKVRGSLVCSDRVVSELRIQRTGSNVKSRTTGLDFRRAELVIFRKEPLGSWSWAEEGSRRAA